MILGPPYMTEEGQCVISNTRTKWAKNTHHTPKIIWAKNVLYHMITMWQAQLLEKTVPSPNPPFWVLYPAQPLSRYKTTTYLTRLQSVSTNTCWVLQREQQTNKKKREQHNYILADYTYLPSIPSLNESQEGHRHLDQSCLSSCMCCLEANQYA